MLFDTPLSPPPPPVVVLLQVYGEWRNKFFSSQMLYYFFNMIKFRINTSYGVVLEGEGVEEECLDSELDHQQPVV